MIPTISNTSTITLHATLINPSIYSRASDLEIFSKNHKNSFLKNSSHWDNIINKSINTIKLNYSPHYLSNPNSIHWPRLCSSYRKLNISLSTYLLSSTNTTNPPVAASPAAATTTTTKGQSAIRPISLGSTIFLISIMVSCVANVAQSTHSPAAAAEVKKPDITTTMAPSQSKLKLRSYNDFTRHLTR